MDTFGRFCDLLGQVGEAVTLRPHPGGQHVLKNRVALAPNVSINNLPIYQVDLAAYEWGISAPSTVIMDMVLAKLPVAVWQDPDGVMDLSAYAGLVRISSVEDWLRFAHDARAAPEAILARQRQWLEGLGMPLDPALVYDRFTRLLQAGTAERVPPPMTRPAAARCPLPRKILFLANNWLATLQIAFQKPLVGLVANGLLETLTITGEEMRANLPNKRPVAAENKWLLEQVDAFEPDLVVACRYNGPGAEALTDHLSAKGIPLVFVIDDDLLNVPREIGEAKYLAYQNPRRRASLTHLLSRADLVFASTPRLKARLRESGFRAPMVAGRIFCAGEVLRPSQNRPVTKIGYMGGADHAHDFTIALPALVECLRVNPHLFFDLFSSMPMPTELASLGPRIRHLSAVIQDYGVFMRELAALEWDIGLCPLAMTPFNMTKNNNKWIEYTAAGAAVVASGGLVYDKCGSDGCAMLVGPDGWGQALQSLIDDPALRHAQVQRAQHRLREEYSEVKMTEQVLEVFDIAMNMPKAQASWPRPSDQAVAAHPIAIPITASHSKSPQVAS